MNDINILVVTHKKFDDALVPNGYSVIKVGNVLSDEEASQLGYLCDDTGDNIAMENPYYCELTAQYWAWKNMPDTIKYTGICHYRRYFFGYSGKSKSYEDDILTADQIRTILGKYKVIMAYPTVKYPGYGKLYPNRPDEKQDKHWVIINKIIKSDYPELYESFKKVMYGRFTIWGNMLITSKDIFDEYSSWVFEVLKKYDNEISLRGEERIPRVDGFISEYLLLVWFYNKFTQKEIYRLEVRNTETDGFYEYQHDNLKAKLIRFIRKHHSLLTAVRYIRILGLLVIRREKNHE
ncbi:DUF4422 domain-containing protein [Neobacillus muris]|uniref:DUF4422 domain-containing protein n=1 Tax=Neobacillus muris TaxID=2941334 RepID=UPI00203CF2D6|nr:DUF4422 domain-containing protein [Neobacillus muris]